MDPFVGQDEVHSCSVCQIIPESIVMLECTHNLCLSCALKTYEGQKRGKIISCSVCQRFSQLDEITVQELNSRLTSIDMGHGRLTAQGIKGNGLQQQDFKFIEEQEQNSQDQRAQRSISPYGKSVYSSEVSRYEIMPVSLPQAQPLFQGQSNDMDIGVNIYHNPQQNFDRTKWIQRQSNVGSENIIQPHSYQGFNTSPYTIKQQNEMNVNNEQRNISQQYQPQVLKESNSNNIEHSSLSLPGKNMVSNNRCKEHPDFEILYFCFGCSGQCICPECAIHGLHKNHNVQDIKRAQQTMKEKVLTILNGNQTTIQNINQQQQKVSALRKVQSDDTEAAEKEIKRQFNELRTILEQQERSLISQCESLKDHNVNQLNSFDENLSACKQKLESLGQSYQQNIGTMNDITFLTYYSENLEKLRNTSTSLSSMGLGEFDIQKNLLSSETLTSLVKPIIANIQSLAVPSQRAIQPNSSIEVQQQIPMSSRQQNLSGRLQIYNQKPSDSVWRHQEKNLEFQSVSSTPKHSRHSRTIDDLASLQFQSAKIVGEGLND